MAGFGVFHLHSAVWASRWSKDMLERLGVYGVIVRSFKLAGMQAVKIKDF
jgi:hypothetical protein